MSVLWLESWYTMKYSLSPQAIFHCISLLSTQYRFNIGNSRIYAYKITYFWFFLHFLDFAFDSHFRILKLQSQQKIYFVEPWSLVQAIMVTHNSVYTHLAFSWKKNCPKSSVNKVVRCNYILHGIFSMFYPESKLTSNQ